MLNFRQILRIDGALLFLLGLMMLLALPFSLHLNAGDHLSILQSAGICFAVGALFWFGVKPVRTELRRRDGFLIVASGWLIMTIFGALPYLLSGVLPNAADAYFETVSGMTTTGASVLTDIESVPKGILFWRSMSQWIGGMGIIVLTVAIFPMLGMGGVELFSAEAPGPTSDKIHPRIQETAKRLWLIYVGLTALETLLLWWADLSFYEAINHALTTMATGGFSTRNASAAAFSPTVQYIMIVFMFIAGVNYSVTYMAFKRQFNRVWSNDEFRYYVKVVLGMVLVVTVWLYLVKNLQGGEVSLEQVFRDAAFQIISLITTTGYVSADYTSWSPALTMFFFILLFLGACAGSTAGGIKFIRHIVFFKNSVLEFRRILHPRAIIPLKINGEMVPGRIITHIIIFLLLYLMTFLAGSLYMSFLGYDFLTSIGAAATALGNVGPGIGKVGPVDNFAWLSDAAKWGLSILMLLGRLELFTILVLFTPYFWRSN